MLKLHTLFLTNLIRRFFQPCHFIGSLKWAAGLMAFCLWSFPVSSLAEATSGTDIKTIFQGGGILEGLKALFKELAGTGLIMSDDIILVTMGWVKLALTLLGTIAFVAFIWAGALYITAFLNSNNAETAKKVMAWTTIGILVILMSYSIVATLTRATV